MPDVFAWLALATVAFIVLWFLYRILSLPGQQSFIGERSSNRTIRGWRSTDSAVSASISKAWLRHGPGSPGSVARAMITAYKTTETRYPHLPRNELLARTLESRYALVPDRWSMPLREREQLLADVNGDILPLIVAVFLIEPSGQWETWLAAPTKVQKLVMEVMIEVVQELAPEASLQRDADSLLNWTFGFEYRWLNQEERLQAIDEDIPF